MQKTNTHVAIATCDHHPGHAAGDDEALAEALRRAGFAPARAVWTDPAIDWTAFAAVLVRTTWDYAAKLPQFLAWMRAVEAATPILNPPDLAVANLNKTYLKNVGDAAVPTLWADRDAEAAGVRDALAAAGRAGWDPLVMKPAIGAGAEGLRIGPLGETDAWLAHAEEIHRRCDAMLQPRIDSIRERGELSIVLIDGELTHAVRKTPAPGDWRVQMEFGGRYALEEPSAPARRAAGAAAALWTEVPLYARIDLVEPEEDDYRIIEVELVEPELFFPMAPHAADAFARALRRRLKALG